MKFFIIKSPKKRKILYLGKGEEETICLALEKRTNLVLIDDHKTRITAEGFGLIVMIKHKEFLLLLNNLIESGFRISIELYNRTIQEAEKYK